MTTSPEPAAVNVESFEVSASEANERIDKVLTARFTPQSRSYFQQLINAGRVTIGGEAVKKQYRPQLGELVTVEFLLTPEISLDPEDISLDIMYEDASIVVVNKFAGLVVHPGPGNWSGTLVNALLFHCQQLSPSTSTGSAAKFRPGIVHRLDKYTTGVLVVAKTREAHLSLGKQFSERTVHKSYLAICMGNPGDGVLHNMLARHPVHRKRRTVVESGGKEAITVYKTLGFDGKISVVELEIKTGRTHQIRVHMQHHRTPVLGDSVYGSAQANEKYKTPHQLLHAHKLSFVHPVTEERMTFTAAPPQEMQRFVDKIMGA